VITGYPEKFSTGIAICRATWHRRTPKTQMRADSPMD